MLFENFNFLSQFNLYLSSLVLQKVMQNLKSHASRFSKLAYSKVFLDQNCRYLLAFGCLLEFQSWNLFCCRSFIQSLLGCNFTEKKNKEDAVRFAFFFPFILQVFSSFDDDLVSLHWKIEVIYYAPTFRRYIMIMMSIRVSFVVIRILSHNTIVHPLFCLPSE